MEHSLELMRIYNEISVIFKSVGSRNTSVNGLHDWFLGYLAILSQLNRVCGII
jgi:hypothetical protein